MTDRERWTVYPLLFLTLGIAVKDRIMDTVVCSTLVVRDRKGNEQVVINTTPSGGVLRAQGTKSGVSVLLGHVDRFAGMMFVDQSGKLTGPNISVQTGPARGAEGPRESTERPAPGDSPPDSASPPQKPPSDGDGRQP